MKLIEYGWDSPRPAFVRAHAAEMAQRPFDGVVMGLPDDGGDVFRVESWQPDRLGAHVAVLRGIQSERLTHNFLAMHAVSSMDWSSDAQWRAVTGHAAFMARAARECGCKGLVFDLEPYGASPWTYETQRDSAAYTFKAYQALVRRRGREFMRALQREKPGLDLFLLEGYSYFLRLRPPPVGPHRDVRLRAHTWGLLPAFLDGLLEEAHGGTRIIDGHERSYFYERPEDFVSGAIDVRQRARLWVSPDLRAKYGREITVAQPVYVDWIFGLYTRSAGSVADGLGHAGRVRLLEQNVSAAMDNVDEYVWIRSEKMNWWTGKDIPAGAEDAIRSAKDRFTAAGKRRGVS